MRFARRTALAGLAILAGCGGPPADRSQVEVRALPDASGEPGARGLPRLWLLAVPHDPALRFPLRVGGAGGELARTDGDGRADFALRGPAVVCALGTDEVPSAEVDEQVCVQLALEHGRRMVLTFGEGGLRPL